MDGIVRNNKCVYDPHSLQGWCPPLPIIRRMGIRTAEEITKEKDALRKLKSLK